MAGVSMVAENGVKEINGYLTAIEDKLMNMMLAGDISCVLEYTKAAMDILQKAKTYLSLTGALNDGKSKQSKRSVDFPKRNSTNKGQAA